MIPLVEKTLQLAKALLNNILHLQNSPGWAVGGCFMYISSCKTFLLIRLDKQLSELEHRHKVVSRWHVRGPQYIEAKCAYLRETQQRVCASLWATITRRQFLLKMKAKYGGKLKCNRIKV